MITGQHVEIDCIMENLHSDRSEQVDHEMRVFLKHYIGKQEPLQIDHNAIKREAEQKSANVSINAVIFDENAIERIF